jgi:hypothetical protein
MRGEATPGVRSLAVAALYERRTAVIDRRYRLFDFSSSGFMAQACVISRT